MEKICNNKIECFGCGACQNICPVGAISMQEDEEGFLYPVIDETKCIHCQKCITVCPHHQFLKEKDSQFYMVRTKDSKVLYGSTSGGAFSLLAHQVLKENGLVCGAIFDENFNVVHVLGTDIAPMRKSKYVQSDMKDCFQKIKSALQEGRKVLFSGTPCQCHAIKLWMGKQDSNLLLVSIVCRGVSSPGLWRDYVAYLSKDQKLQSFDFRDKRRPNNAHTVAYTIGEREKTFLFSDEKYARLYNKCLTYRPSCYHCPYCRPNNNFDFTIGDFWGIEKVYPEYYDGMGNSLVIARGKTALEMIEKMKEEALVIPCREEQSLQVALKEPAKETILRKLLFNLYAKKDQENHCNMDEIIKRFGS